GRDRPRVPAGNRAHAGGAVAAAHLRAALPPADHRPRHRRGAGQGVRRRRRARGLGARRRRHRRAARRGLHGGAARRPPAPRRPLRHRHARVAPLPAARPGHRVQAVPHGLGRVPPRRARPRGRRRPHRDAHRRRARRPPALLRHGLEERRLVRTGRRHRCRRAAARPGGRLPAPARRPPGPARGAVPHRPAAHDPDAAGPGDGSADPAARGAHPGQHVRGGAEPQL
ncbi:MAG: Uncharacterized protein, similar to the N-terminal domain of Lon protease, partial [uncultured Pseudonocardia sp.]